MQGIDNFINNCFASIALLVFEKNMIFSLFVTQSCIVIIMLNNYVVET